MGLKAFYHIYYLPAKKNIAKEGSIILKKVSLSEYGSVKVVTLLTLISLSIPLNLIIKSIFIYKDKNRSRINSEKHP